MAEQPLSALPRIPMRSRRAGHGSPWQRVRALKKKPPTRVEVRVDDKVQTNTQTSTPGASRCSARDRVRPPMMHIGIDRAKPHLKLVVSPLKSCCRRSSAKATELSSLTRRRVPAARSARRDAVELFKRTVIPMLEGLGKGAWAVIVLLLAPVISRFFDWLGQYLPDWQMPDITLPHLDLPIPNLPQLDLPSPNWPVSTSRSSRDAHVDRVAGRVFGHLGLVARASWSASWHFAITASRRPKGAVGPSTRRGHAQ